MGMVRVAVLGQKDAMVRALYVLAHMRRGRELDVLVVLPKLQRQEPHDCGAPMICQALGFRCWDCGGNADLLGELRGFGPDLIVSILWPRRIQDEVLALCKDCINFHPSLLPRHRGSLTQFWAIFDGDAESGVTCHRMVHEFDAGRILHQVAAPLAPDETAISLSRKIATAAERCFEHVLGLFLREGLPEGDDWEVGCFPYHFHTFPNDGVVDPAWPEAVVERFLRAMYFPPHPPAMAQLLDGRTRPVTTFEEYREAITTADG